MEIIGNAVIQKDGTLILPQNVIQRLDLKFGDELFFVVKAGEITIGKLPDAMKRTVDYYLAIGCDRLAAEYYAGGRKRLTGAKANPDFTLTPTYEEREERIYDCKPLLEKGGVFVHLRKYENFARVFIEYGTVYYLLGSFKFLDENTSINEQLGIMNYDFENLYRTIWEKHRRLFWISSVDGYSGIAYYSGVFTPCGFDSSGKLLNAQLYFVKFPNMDRSNAFVEDILCKLDDVEYMRSNTLTVTQDCMPIEILPLLPPKKKRMK